MKVLVAVKRVVDPSVSVRVKSDGSGVDLENVKMGINPFCEIAVEAAVQLKEKGVASEVIVVSIGPPKAEDALRAALAMGADRGILVLTEERLEPLGIAKVLRAVTREEEAEIVLLGKQAIDDDANQTGQMLGGLLGWGQGTFASRLEIADGIATVTREVDSGLQTLAIPLPAIVTVDLRMNQPRFASLPNIMKARAKPLQKVSAADYGVDLTPRLRLVKVEAPPPRKAGVMVVSVSELVDRLRALELVS